MYDLNVIYRALHRYFNKKLSVIQEVGHIDMMPYFIEIEIEEEESRIKLEIESDGQLMTFYPETIKELIIIIKSHSYYNQKK